MLLMRTRNLSIKCLASTVSSDLDRYRTFVLISMIRRLDSNACRAGAPSIRTHGSCRPCHSKMGPQLLLRR